MKTLGFTLLLLLSGTAIYAQDYDARLLKSYSEAALEEMQSNDANKLGLITYALENGMYITEGNAKTAGLPTIDMPADDATFADLGLQITNQNQYFQINGDTRILVVKSFWVLNNELETK